MFCQLAPHSKIKNRNDLSFIKPNLSGLQKNPNAMYTMYKYLKQQRDNYSVLVLWKKTTRKNIIIVVISEIFEGEAKKTEKCLMM